MPKTDPAELLVKYKFKRAIRIQEDATGKVRDVIEFPTTNGEVSQIEIRPSRMNKPDLQDALLDRDAALPDGKEHDVLWALRSVQPEVRQRYPAHAGWSHKNERFFVGSRVLGDAGEYIGRQFAQLCAEYPSLDVRGSVRDWSVLVAKAAACSSAMMLSICANFAAPLMKFVDMESFIVCFCGPSRAGKSIATLVGGSVIGYSHVKQITTWNATQAALDERLPDYMDLVVPIDDLASLEGNVKHRSERMRDLSYVLASSQGKAKSSTYMKEHGLESQSWRTIIITQSEHTATELAKLSNSTRPMGECVRLIDIPVLMDAATIFDRVDISKIKDLQDWRGKKLADLIDECRASHGAVFDTYIDRLRPMAPALAVETNALITKFIDAATDDFDGPEARDLARKFGLIYAGGILAVQFKLVGWTNLAVLRAVRKCYKAARDLLPDESKILKDGLQRLDTKLSALPRRNERKKIYTCGYREKHDKDNDRCVIGINKFNNLFAGVLQKELVLDHLIEADRIETILSKKKDLHQRPKCQFSWPNGERRRSYAIMVPRDKLERRRRRH